MIYGAQSLDRALALLDAIAVDDGQTPVAQIAGACNLAPSSARRMVTALERHGLIARIAHGRYAAGPRLMTLAAGANPARSLIAAARAPLRMLHRKAIWTTHLGVFDNDMVTYLIKEGGNDLFTREGAELEAYCTGIGKALLAQLPQDELDAYLAGPFVRLTPHTICEPSELRSEIEKTRERGFAIDNREMSDSIACVAAPIPLGHGRLAAISLSGDADHFPLHQADRVAQRLHRVARVIAERMAAHKVRTSEL